MLHVNQKFQLNFSSVLNFKVCTNIYCFVFFVFSCFKKTFLFIFFNTECSGLKALSLRSFQYHLEWFGEEKKKLYSAWFGKCLKLCHPPSWSTEQIVGLSYFTYFTYFTPFHTAHPCSTPHHTLNRLPTEGGTAWGAKNHPRVRGHFIISKPHYIRQRR